MQVTVLPPVENYSKVLKQKNGKCIFLKNVKRKDQVFLRKMLGTWYRRVGTRFL